MIYEFRTFSGGPGVPREVEEVFGNRHPFREKYSRLAFCGHTDIGPLNQVLMIWPYDSFQHRDEANELSGKDEDLKKLPRNWKLPTERTAEIFNPAPFMQPMIGREFGKGNVYEVRTYTFAQGGITQIMKDWELAIPAREKLTPFVGAFYCELGALDKWVHIWVYKDLNERARVRDEARALGVWPPKTTVKPLRQENKIMIPAKFSPLR